jgi:uncharacterized protein (DUF433 family)
MGEWLATLLYYVRFRSRRSQFIYSGRHRAMSQPPVVHSHPEIVSGEPVFVGTRVPARNLVDWLEGGHTLDEFLDNFPSVTREQAVAFLEQAAEALLSRVPQAA